MAEEKTIEEKKMTSRKFLVWIVWVIITIGIIVLSFFKKDSDDLVKTGLHDLFFISLTYLGVNGIQKVGFALSDSISLKTNDSPSNSNLYS